MGGAKIPPYFKKKLEIMIETILIIYFSIAGISMFCTALWLMDYLIEEIDGFWDWVVYNVFWIAQPIKSIIKFFKNL